MATAPVILILGSGSGIGLGVAQAFAAKGYKVASTSRSGNLKYGNAGNAIALHIESDLSNPESVVDVFRKVNSSLGPPSVVVYNAFAHTPNPADDPLSLSVRDLNQDFQVNTASVLVAAQEAVDTFDKLPTSASRTFIYTGNKLNTGPIGPFLSLGIGKSASAHLIESASKAYAPRGYRFYFADERKPDGSPPYGGINGPAHGHFYTELADGDQKLPWQATFVAGTGYKDFSSY